MWDSVRDPVSNLCSFGYILVLVVVVGKVELFYASKTGTSENGGGIDLLSL